MDVQSKDTNKEPFFQAKIPIHAGVPTESPS
jgi:hypothetical protein